MGSITHAAMAYTGDISPVNKLKIPVLDSMSIGDRIIVITHGFKDYGNKIAALEDNAKIRDMVLVHFIDTDDNVRTAGLDEDLVDSITDPENDIGYELFEKVARLICDKETEGTEFSDRQFSFFVE